MSLGFEGYELNRVMELPGIGFSASPIGALHGDGCRSSTWIPNDVPSTSGGSPNKIVGT